MLIVWRDPSWNDARKHFFLSLMNRKTVSHELLFPEPLWQTAKANSWHAAHNKHTLLYTFSLVFALSSRVVGEWSCTHRHKETSAATFAPVSAAHRRQQELGVLWGNRDAQTRTFSPRNSQTYLLNPAWSSNMPSKPFSFAQTVMSSRSRL